MPARTPGKTSARSGSKTGKTGTGGAKTGSGTGKPPSAKAKSGGRPKPQGTAARTKPPAGRPPRPKAKSPAGKRKRRRKEVSLLTRYKPYLLGLTLGLMLGCLGAVAVFYLPQLRMAPPPVKPAAGPAGRPAEQQPPQEQAHKWAKLLPYEENAVLETRIKELDHQVYNAAKMMEVPDEAIHFMNVTSQIRGDRKWDHALIEVELPAGLAADQLVQTLEAVLSKSSLRPRPRLKTKSGTLGLAAEIYYDGLHTHTLELIPAPPALPKTAKTVASPPEKPAPTMSPKPKVAIIIDDLGLNLEQARCFLDLDMPLSFSVLPFLEHSKEVAVIASQKQRDVLLHLPMQPAQWPDIDAGPGVLLVSMDRPEIEARVQTALEAVPFIIGVNNHMGSRFTEDPERIGWVMEILKSRNLFFVDSLTSTRSKAYTQAHKLGLRCDRRSTFLDNIQDPEAIRIQIRRLIAQAGQNGRAIGIGHVYPVTCQVLKSEYNYINSKVDLVPIHNLFQ
jgi:polysaccharide deacetylase 2 family uncharacterized protein YibQ